MSDIAKRAKVVMDKQTAIMKRVCVDNEPPTVEMDVEMQKLFAELDAIIDE